MDVDVRVGERMDIRSMPTETLGAIFEAAVSGQLQTANGQNHAIIIGQVCKRWRTIAHDTPRLWCRISSRIPRFLLSRFFRNSKTRPLCISIDFLQWMDETATKVAVLLEHLYRVQDLEIRASSREDMELCWYHLKKPAPQLVTFRIFLDDETTEYKLPSEYLGAGSALQSLSLRNVVMVWDLPNLHNLSTLSLQFNADDISVSSIVEMLQQSPMLENLTIGSPYLANDEFPDSTVALCHLRCVALKICNIRAFEPLLSVLDLPMDVHCTLLLHPDAFYNQRQQYTLPLPRHLTSASVCRKLECYFAFGRVKVEASVSPNAESRSTTRVSIRMGPVPHIDDESQWLCRSFKGGNMFLHDLAGIDHLADIVSTRSFFANTLLLDLSFDKCLDNSISAGKLTGLFRQMETVRTVSISLGDGASLPLSGDLMSQVVNLSSLRDLRIQMSLRNENLDMLERYLQFRMLSSLPPIQRLCIVGGETLSAEERRKVVVLAPASVVVFGD